MNRRVIWLSAVLCLALLLGACGASPVQETAPAAAEETHIETPHESAPGPQPEEKAPAEEDGSAMLYMILGETAVSVDWEDNESVDALKELCRDEPLSIQLSMYGGFEQVGPIGTSLPRNDVQTRTRSGDIVLYAGNQIVVFYGSNSWAYTRLGHITDQSDADMEALLGHGDVSVTFSLENAP